MVFTAVCVGITLKQGYNTACKFAGTPMSTQMNEIPLQEAAPDLKLSICKKLNIKSELEESLGPNVSLPCPNVHKENTCKTAEPFNATSLESFLVQSGRFWNISELLEGFDGIQLEGSSWISQIENSSFESGFR
ncbi:uncharacterized protein LOC111698529 [Eurytemora carolleeae]|uniref:uncharacterized protein LOC111698529 n=1 Tax=Eurytemora carolleeae TaxID=1294199 RepID=UPI000C778A73|nr:uncharacterized protein LOC111698529 [Eurytemora carolleeae]|eukprot:XP_023324652.1 uncharacterized protein LOC111698529 [Eurytemora affinis]